jgi:uncharacterized membrane protein YbhN (UPF0104 family)
LSTTAGRSRLKAIALWLLGAIAFAALVMYLVPSWDDLTGRADVAAPYLLVGLAGAALAHVAVAARWKLLSEATGGTRLGFWAYLHSLLVTRFIGQFAPSLAMDLVGRGVALRTVGSKRGIGHATTLVVLERLFDLIIPAALLLWAFTVRRPGLEDQAAALLALTTAAFLLIATPGLRPLARLALRIYARVARVPDGELPVGVTTWIAFQVALLGVARFAAVLVQFAGIGAGVGIFLGWSDWMAATPLAQLTALVGITPGGLGVVEAGWWAGLAWVGVEGPVIGLFLLAQRTALIAFLGTLALATWPLARGGADRVQTPA